MSLCRRRDVAHATLCFPSKLALLYNKTAPLFFLHAHLRLPRLRLAPADAARGPEVLPALCRPLMPSVLSSPSFFSLPASSGADARTTGMYAAAHCAMEAMM